jgi:hypothetical protein
MVISRKIIVFIALFHLSTHAFEKVHYLFSDDPIDVVIPCHPKDAATLDRAITSVKKYVVGLRRIMVISSERITDNAEWIDEKIFPFTKQSLAHEIFKYPDVVRYQFTKKESRIGWIYQQFLKLYAAFCIPDISSNILIVDSDIVFLKPVDFLCRDKTGFSYGAGLYAVGKEYHPPYFEHAARLLPGLKKLYPEYSGIVHHMLFQKPVLIDLFNLIHQQHQVEPWIAIARAIKVVDNDINPSCLSEYEIYFNFVFARTDQVKLRPLKWVNRELAWGPVHDYDIEGYRQKGYDYVAIHQWGA